MSCNTKIAMSAQPAEKIKRLDLLWVINRLQELFYVY